MADDPLAQPTVLSPPSGARVTRDRVYRTDELGSLALDVYAPSQGDGPWPAVLLVNGDADEAVIARAKDWGVFRSYGEHLAARGIVGAPFNHRSTQTLGRDEVAAEVDAALRLIRENAAELSIDPDRIGIWAFSAAGAFVLAPLFRTRPRYVRAVAGFYTVWDLAAFRGSRSFEPTADVIEAWSATVALAASNAGLPPIFVGVAEKDAPALVGGADAFIARARELGIDLRVERHQSGVHGFDVRTDDDRSREIIRAALEFFVTNLGA